MYIMYHNTDKADMAKSKILVFWLCSIEILPGLLDIVIQNAANPE